MTMAMVVTCLKDIWWIESTPAENQTFTMMAYAADEATGGAGRTAVLSGHGAVAADGERRVEFSLRTVPALAGSDHHDQIAAVVTAQPDGTYAGQVEVVEESHRKWNGHGQRKCHRRCDDKSKAKKRRCKKRCRKHN